MFCWSLYVCWAVMVFRVLIMLVYESGSFTGFSHDFDGHDLFVRFGFYD